MRAWKSGVWSLGGQALNAVITIGTLAVLGRLLSPAEFGIFGLVLAVHAMAKPFLDMGLMPVYIKLENADNNASNVFFTINLLAGCVVASLVLLISPWVARYYGVDTLQPLLMVSALSLFLTALEGQPQAVMMRSKKFDTIVKVQAAVLLAGSGLVAGLAWLGYGVWALVWRMLFEAAARFMVLAWASKNKFRVVNFQKIRPWLHELKFGMEIVGSRLAISWVGSLDKLILGKFGTLGELGGYSRSQQFALMPDGNIRTSLTAPALAYLARIQSTAGRLDNYLFLCWVVFLCAGVPCLLLAALGDILLPIILGAQWAEMGWMLQWLGMFGLASVFQGLSVVYFMDNRMANQTTFYSGVSLLAVFVLPISILYLTGSVQYFVAILSVLSVIFWFVVLLRSLYVTCQENPGKIISVNFGIALTGVASTGLALAMREALAMQPISELLVVTGVQLTICALMFYLLGHSYFNRLKEMMKRKK